MANQPELVQYDAGVYQIETTDPVVGGVGGISNLPLLNLSNRTAYLKQHMDDLEAGNLIPATVAPKNSPAFTGTPTAPTPAAGDNSTKIATTEFVNRAIFGVATVSVAGGSNVTLTQSQYGNGIIILTGTITANINVIFPAQAGMWQVINSTSGSFSITCKTPSGSGVVVTQGRSSSIYGDGTNIGLQQTDFISPAMTGTPTTTTPTSGDNSTKVASTAFVFNAVDGMSSVNVAGGSNVTLTAAQAGTGIIKLTGALTANINLILPSQTGQYIIANATTGSFTITAKMATGTGVILPQTLAVVVYSDGTNVYLASSSGQSSFSAQSYSPAAGTTSLTVTSGYTIGNVIVDKNGGLLQDGVDFTATNGVTISLTSPSVAGDKFTVYAFSSFTLANAYTKPEVDASQAVQDGRLNALEGAYASQSVKGPVELADVAEGQALTDLLRVLTPGVLAAIAVSANTANRIVRRDSSGNFSANTITATLAGNASTATALATARSIGLSGDATGSVSFNGSGNVTIPVVVVNNSHTHDKTTITSAVSADKLTASDEGSAPHYAVRAWVEFTGASGYISVARNVSSVTRSGTGDYTVNFSTAMPSSAFAVVASCSSSGGNDSTATTGSVSSSTAYVHTYRQTGGGEVVAVDASTVSVIVCR